MAWRPQILRSPPLRRWLRPWILRTGDPPSVCCAGLRGVSRVTLVCRREESEVVFGVPTCPSLVYIAPAQESAHQSRGEVDCSKNGLEYAGHFYWSRRERCEGICGNSWNDAVETVLARGQMREQRDSQRRCCCAGGLWFNSMLEILSAGRRREKVDTRLTALWVQGPTEGQG